MFRKKGSKSPRAITCSAPNKQLDTIRDSRLISAAPSACRRADIWLSAVKRRQTQLKTEQMSDKHSSHAQKEHPDRACHLSPNQKLCLQRQQERIPFGNERIRLKLKLSGCYTQAMYMQPERIINACMCNHVRKLPSRRVE